MIQLEPLLGIEELSKQIITQKHLITISEMSKYIKKTLNTEWKWNKFMIPYENINGYIMNSKQTPLTYQFPKEIQREYHQLMKSKENFLKNTAVSIWIWKT